MYDCRKIIMIVADIDTVDRLALENLEGTTFPIHSVENLPELVAKELGFKESYLSDKVSYYDLPEFTTKWNNEELDEINNWIGFVYLKN